MFRSLICAGMFLVLVVPLGFGIETSDPPPEYLRLNIRPNWRWTPVDEALNELAEQIERPISLSKELQDSDLELIVLEEERSPVREILELLEQTYDLHFRAEALRIVAITGSEQRMKERKRVNLDLRDYGLFFAPRASTALQIESQEGDASPASFSYYEDDDQLDAVLDLLGEYWQGESTRTGNANIMIKATPGEEQKLRLTLDQLYQLKLRRSTWRVHFGEVPSGAAVVDGVVDSAGIGNMVKQLQRHQRFDVTASHGVKVQGQLGSYQLVIGDIEINQTGSEPVRNPVPKILFDGVRGEIEPMQGLTTTLLRFDFDWNEVLDDGSAVEYSSRPRMYHGGEGPQMFAPGVVYPLEGCGTWSWNAQGDVYLAKGQGLVLVATRGDDRLAIVVEEVQE